MKKHSRNSKKQKTMSFVHMAIRNMQKEEEMSILAYVVYCYLSGNNGSEAIKIKEVI